MVKRNYFSHHSKSGTDPVDRIARAGGSGAIGEDLAWGSGSYGSPSAIVKLWLNSPPHRRVLFAKDLRYVGIGRATGRFQGYQRRGGLHGRFQRTRSLILQKARPTSVGTCLGDSQSSRRCTGRGCSWQARATFAALLIAMFVAAPAARRDRRGTPHGSRRRRCG